MISILRNVAWSRNCVALTQTFRFKSTGIATQTQAPFPMTVNMQREMDQFMHVFPGVLQQLTDFGTEKPILKGVADHFKRALEYNVPTGKRFRGFNTVLVYKDLIGEDRLTTENIRQAHLLGWCVEIFRGDGGEIRYNSPCWYKLKDVQIIAVNDIIMLENACYKLLKQSFGQLPCYGNMHEMFHETAMMTCIGQSLDFQMTKANIATFSKENYRCLVDHKTSHFGLFTPFVLAMMLAGYEDSDVFERMRETCMEMSYFYQVNNDFFDCFGNALMKPGTDIEDGKFSWLAVTAMELGSDEQRDIIKRFYGKNDPESINKVKQLYIDLELPEKFSRFKEDAYNHAKLQIDHCSNDKKLHLALTNALNRIFDQNVTSR